MSTSTTNLTTTKSFVLTKKEVAVMLNCVTPSGTISYYRLRRSYFNDEILEKLGISLKRYKEVHKKPFSIEESRRIVAYHNLYQKIIDIIQ